MAVRDMKVSVGWSADLNDEPKQLDSGGYLIAPFRATFTDEQVRVEMVIDVIDGTPDCTAYTVDSVDGVGLLSRTTEVHRGLKIRELMAEALAMSVWDDAGLTFGRASAAELVEAVTASVRRRRVPVTDERLKEVADAHRQRWRSGGAAEFARSINCSERQMWRLVKLARERGFLEDSE